MLNRSELLFCVVTNLLLVSLLIGSFQVGRVEASSPYLQYVIEYNYSPPFG